MSSPENSETEETTTSTTTDKTTDKNTDQNTDKNMDKNTDKTDKTADSVNIETEPTEVSQTTYTNVDNADERTTADVTAEPSMLSEDSNDDGSDSDNESVIVAMAPKVAMASEDTMIVEVSSSPAFQCLDDLFQEGKLTGTKVALLKSKYIELHNTLKRSRENETNLLSQAKGCSKDLEHMCQDLDFADHFPEGANNEVGKLRQELLKHSNELAQAEDRQYQLEYKVECLKEERVLVEKEYARKPKVGETEKKIKELQTATDDLKRDIAKLIQKKRNLQEDIDGKCLQLEADNKEYNHLMDKVDELKVNLLSVNTLPGIILKEADKLFRQKKEIDSERETIDTEYNERIQLIKSLEKRRVMLEEDKFEEDTELDKRQSLLEVRERELNILLKDFEYAKEKESVLMTDKAMLDQSLRHSHAEKKMHHDQQSRKTREKDRDMRTLRKLELQMKNAEDTLIHTKTVYDKVKGNLDALPKDDGTLQRKREDLQKEVEQIKRSLATQNSLTAVEHVKLEASAAEEQDLLYEQSDLRIEVIELARLAQIKADEREGKARDFMRAEMRYHRTIEDLKSRHLQINDHQKKYVELQIRMKEFAKLYDVIKNERNKCVNLIQQSMQKAAEMREKIKINANEVEILRSAVTNKEKTLQKQRLKHMNAIVFRDSMRNEVAKQQNVLDDMRTTQEQQKMDIHKLNQMINQAEEQMVKLRKRYENAVQYRNKRGIDLIERNEEVCIFYEKVNIQDLMLRNGNIELQGREEELRFMRIKMDELKRTNGLLGKVCPEKRNIEREIVTQQIQLSQCQDRLLELEKLLENPDNKERARFLEGNDLSPTEMKQKIEDLEQRLAGKEELILEKDLISEQVLRLVQRVQTKSDAGKMDTLELAKKINNQQRQIKGATRKMMALVAELSMNQANSLKLQQDLKEKEGNLEICYVRMEKGEPPNEEAEKDWMRYIRDMERRENNASFITEEEKEGNLEICYVRMEKGEPPNEEAEKDWMRYIRDMERRENNASFITEEDTESGAPVRYNAYIPDDDSELPIARPYGKHAPFQQTPNGSNMRHFRKPALKPIEI